MNYLAAYQKLMRDDLLRIVTPNVLIVGPVKTTPGFPLETCGNECAREGATLAR